MCVVHDHAILLIVIDLVLYGGNAFFLVLETSF